MKRTIVMLELVFITGISAVCYGQFHDSPPPTPVGDYSTYNKDKGISDQEESQVGITRTVTDLNTGKQVPVDSPDAKKSFKVTTNTLDD